MAKMRADLRAVVTAEGAAVLDVRRGTISPLNDTGAFVWQGLLRGEDAALIARRLALETGAAPDLVERDVQSFIEALKRSNLHPDR